MAAQNVEGSDKRPRVHKITRTPLRWPTSVICCPSSKAITRAVSRPFTAMLITASQKHGHLKVVSPAHSTWRMRATRSSSHSTAGSGSSNAAAMLPAPRAGSDHSCAVVAPNGLALTRNAAIPGTGCAMMTSPRRAASTSVISVWKVTPVFGRIR